MSRVLFLILYLHLKDKRFSWRCVVWYKVWCDFQLNRVKLVEKEKNALEGEKNKAVDFLTLENDIFRHKSRLCQYHVWVHQHLFKTWNHIISFHFCGHSTGEVVAFMCYSWCFVTGLWGFLGFFSIFSSVTIYRNVWWTKRKRRTWFWRTQRNWQRKTQRYPRKSRKWTRSWKTLRSKAFCLFYWSI